MKVQISTQAMLDIQRNAEWWALHHSRSQAEEWFYCVYDQIEAIANAPLSYGLSAEKPRMRSFRSNCGMLSWGLEKERVSGRSSEFRKITSRFIVS